MMKLSYSLLLATILFFCSCSSKKAEPDQPEAEEHDPNSVELTQEQYRSVGIQTGRLEMKNLSNYVKASGTIDVPPKDLISIASPYGGTIRSTSVLEGRFVKKNETLATIENPEFVQVQQDYLESASQLTYLRQEFDRQQELVKENIAARKSLQRAQSEFNTMAARLEGLKAKLRILNINPSKLTDNRLSSVATIHAPSDGYITHVYSNTGKFIGANELLADMANTDNIQIKIRIFEKDLSRIRMGQRIRYTASGDTVEREAEVFLIGKDIDADRTVEVHGRILDRSSSLLPGMFISAIVEIGTSSTPALPQQSIVQSGGKSYIFIQDQSAQGKSDKKHIAFRRVEVGVGASENGYTTVILPEGFDNASNIVVKGAYDLLSKMNNSDEEDE